MHDRVARCRRFFLMLCTLAGTVLACGGTDVSELPPTGPGLKYVTYYNADVSPLAAVARLEYTHVIVSFLRARIGDDGSIELVSPPKMGGQWDSVETVKSSGKRVLVSFGGGLARADEYAALVGREDELATAIARFVNERNLDGVDIDFEASSMLYLRRPAGVADGRAFLIALTRHLRAHLPAPRYELTHAPQPPYLNPEWHGGPYLDVLKATAGDIDWVSVQYYNNPGHDASVAEKVVGTEGAPWPTSYRGLVDPSGPLAWPSDKLLVGKPVNTTDAANGFVPPAEIRQQIVEPLCALFGSGFGGLIGWQFSTATENNRDWNYEMPAALSPAKCHKETRQ